MGGTTFEGIYEGTDANETFSRATSDAAHENGHGGYTGTIAEKHSFVIIQHQPLTPGAARALAHKLINDGDERIDDKWGDAGAIPVVTGKRKTTLVRFEGSLAAWKADPIAEATKVLRARKELHRGESVATARLYGHDSRGSDAFTRGTAEVTINKPGGPYERDVTVKIEFPGVISWQNEAEWGPVADAKVRLKEGERIISRQMNSALGAEKAAPVTKVHAEATKGKTETRYFLGGVHSQGRAWTQGYETQAAARAAAVDMASKPPRFGGDGQLRIEIEAVTRRAGGEPLVVVERRIVKATADIIVNVAKTPAGPPDAWLFFGWASS